MKYNHKCQQKMDSEKRKKNIANDKLGYKYFHIGT